MPSLPPCPSGTSGKTTEQNDTGTSSQVLTTILTGESTTCASSITNRRIPSTYKDSELSTKQAHNIPSGLKNKAYVDAALREEFDFGSLQNLQDPTFHHRPLRLRDLERLEGNKFIIPQQERSNQHRKRSYQQKMNQPSGSGGYIDTADIYCDIEEESLPASRSTIPCISPPNLTHDSSSDSISPLPSTSSSANKIAFAHNIININERPRTTVEAITETTFWRLITQHISDPLLSFKNLIAESLLQAALGCLSAIIDASNTGSIVPRGKVRIRWTCKCGKRLYDDFIEQRPGAARILELHLNRPRQRLEGKGGGSDSVSTSSSISVSSGLSSSTRTTLLDSEDISNPSNLRNKSPYIPALGISGPQSSTNAASFQEQLWLLTCAEKHKFTTKLMHLDMNPYKVCSDRELALLVKEQYSKQRSRWRHMLRLRGLRTIRFVQFEVHRNQVVDIRKCPDLPERSNLDYKFVPSDVMPPVGENYLMHLFHHPEDYEDELITYKRIPKKRGIKLRVGNTMDVGVGWGVHLVEGFIAYKVWTLFTGLFSLASFVFAIVWAVKKDDVQGAFGVSAYVCTLSTLLIGCAMAYLEG